MVPFFSFTAARYSLAVLYGVSALTQRMNWSRARRATGVRSFQENGTPVCNGVVNRFESVMMIVWASPFLPFTCRKPSAPAPPDLLTTMKGRGESLCFSAMPAMRRAIWSAPPPAPAGITNSIGLVGSQANAGAARNSPVTTANSVRRMGILSIVAVLLSSEGGDARPSAQPGATVATRCASPENNTGPDAITRPAPHCMTDRLITGPGRLLHVQRRLCGVQFAKRHDAGDLPLLPLLVHLRLEVRQVLLGEVGEAALLEQVFPHGLARAALDDRLGLAVVLHHAVLDLVEREDARLDGELAELMTEHRVVVPALRARIQRVNERGAADGQRAADLVHHLHRVGGTHGRHVAGLRVAGGHHARHVLLPARVDDALGFSGRAERRVGAVRRHPRELDVRVRVRLVVVEQDQRVVFLVRHRRGDGAHAHVRTAAVTAERDDVDGLGLHLALPHQHLE